MRTAFIPLLGFSIVACGPSQTDLDEARREIAESGDRVGELEVEVDDLNDKLSTASSEADESTTLVADLNAQVDDLSERIVDVEIERDDALERATDLGSDIAEAESDLELLEQERDDLAEAQRKAETERDAVLLRFDPDIQAAIAGAQAQAEDLACTYARERTVAGESVGSYSPIIEPALEGLPEGAGVDMAVIETVAADCVAEGEVLALQAELRSPKGDGFHTVGLEIAAGRWRSSGTGDSCYWQRSPDGRPDDIIDNHFGNAGGTVTLRDGEEFESDRCGSWEFVD